MNAPSLLSWKIYEKISPTNFSLRSSYFLLSTSHCSSDFLPTLLRSHSRHERRADPGISDRVGEIAAQRDSPSE